MRGDAVQTSETHVSDTLTGTRVADAGLKPARLTTITGEGTVVRHDVSRFGLHTTVIAVKDKYPDIELWMEMVKGRVMLHHYSEKVTVNVFTGYLWLWWKDEG